MSNESSTGPEEQLRQERRFIEGVRRELQEEARFFSNTAKPERERWVVSEFLGRLDVEFARDELLSPEQDDDVDVVFRDARFQVKEIPDRDLRRTKEVKERLRRAEQAKRVADLVEVAPAQDIVLSDAYQLMLDEANSSRYPPSRRVKLDLLFYLTRSHAGLGSEEARQQLDRTGWRSVSCLYGRNPLVIATTDAAPKFLRRAARLLIA